MLVTLFSKNIAIEVRNKVRSYVFRILEGYLDIQADYSNPDDTEYPLELAKKKDMVVNVDDLSAAEDPSNPGDLEEISS